ncbi:MAG: hypothetical protein ABSA26_06025 [Thermoguttaceae bacterium]
MTTQEYSGVVLNLCTRMVSIVFFLSFCLSGCSKDANEHGTTAEEKFGKVINVEKPADVNSKKTTKNVINAEEWEPSLFAFLADNKVAAASVHVTKPIVMRRDEEYNLIISLQPMFIGLAKSIPGGNLDGLEELSAAPLKLTDISFKSEMKSESKINGSFVLNDSKITNPHISMPFILELKVPKTHSPGTGDLIIEIPINLKGATVKFKAQITIPIRVE